MLHGSRNAQSIQRLAYVCGASRLLELNLDQRPSRKVDAQIEASTDEQSQQSDGNQGDREDERAISDLMISTVIYSLIYQ